MLIVNQRSSHVNICGFTMSALFVTNRRVDCKGLVSDLFNGAAFPHSWHKFLAALAIGNPGSEIVGSWKSGTQSAGLEIKFPHSPTPGALHYSSPESITLEGSNAALGFAQAQITFHRRCATVEQWDGLRRLLGIYRTDLIRALDFSALCYENTLGQAFMRAVLDTMNRPALLVTSDGILLFSNDEGEAELTNKRLLIRGSDQRVRLNSSTDNAKFQQLIRDVAATKSSSKRLSIAQQGGEQGKLCILEVSSLRPLHAVGLPLDLPAIVLISLRRPDSGTALSSDMLVAALSMTPTEARLACALAQGHSVADFARSADIKMTTARWHLRNIMSRLECRSQSDLVRLVLNVCA